MNELDRGCKNTFLLQNSIHIFNYCLFKIFIKEFALLCFIYLLIYLFASSCCDQLFLFFKKPILKKISNKLNANEQHEKVKGVIWCLHFSLISQISECHFDWNKQILSVLMELKNCLLFQKYAKKHKIILIKVTQLCKETVLKKIYDICGNMQQIVYVGKHSS